jgi:hypothetical protein
MRALLILAVLGMLGYWAYGKFTGPSVRVETSADGTLLMNNGPWSMELARLGDVKADLRVFGADRNATSGNVGSFAFISHLVFATPLAANEAVFDKYLCERKSVDQAALIQVIAEDERLDAQIASIGQAQDRGCARLEGTSYRIARVLEDGKDITDTMRFSPPPNSDPWKIVLVKGIHSIDCR